MSDNVEAPTLDFCCAASMMSVSAARIRAPARRCCAVFRDVSPVSEALSGILSDSMSSVAFSVSILVLSHPRLAWASWISQDSRHVFSTGTYLVPHTHIQLMSGIKKTGIWWVNTVS